MATFPKFIFQSAFLENSSGCRSSEITIYLWREKACKWYEIRKRWKINYVCYEQYKITSVNAKKNYIKAYHAQFMVSVLDSENEHLSVNNPNIINLPSPRPQWSLFSFSLIHIFATGSAVRADYSIGTAYFLFSTPLNQIIVFKHEITQNRT